MVDTAGILMSLTNTDLHLLMITHPVLWLTTMRFVVLHV